MSDLSNIAHTDIQNSGYVLNDNAPKELKTLVRPTQLIAVKDLSFDITFQGDSIKEVDTKVTDAKSGGVSLNLFNWPISFDASGSTSNESATHTADWNKQTGTMSVKPRSFGYEINIAAIVGERINIAA